MAIAENAARRRGAVRRRRVDLDRHAGDRSVPAGRHGGGDLGPAALHGVPDRLRDRPLAERAEQNLHIDDSLSQRLETAHTDEDKAAARGELWKHRASSVLERTSDVAIGVWENTKRNLSETGVAQKLRWKLLNHGTTYAFDAQIEHLKVKAAAVEDKKQREARKFDELKARFEAGAIDIERNKAEHLADFDESLKKIEERNQEIQEKKKEHERKVQELKDGVNNRITGRIREVQEKYNLQFNKEKQVELKNCIVTSESQLKTAKERHDELEAQIKVLFGTGIMGWIRKKTGAKSESVLEATVLSDEEMKALSDEEKEIKKINMEIFQ